MKKYFYRVIGRDGTVMMDKKSDYAYKLIDADRKAHTMSNGEYSLERYLARVETNIPDSVMYYVDVFGAKI